MKDSMTTRDRIVMCMQNVGIMDENNVIINKSSLYFIAFFIELEEEFKIRIPEQYLSIELFDSMEFLIELIDSLKGDKDEIL